MDITSEDDQPLLSSADSHKVIVPSTDKEKVWLCVLKTWFYEGSDMTETVNMLFWRFGYRFSKKASWKIFCRMKQDRNPIYQSVVSIGWEDDNFRDIRREINAYKLTLVESPSPSEYPISSPEGKRWLCLLFNATFSGVHLDPATVNKTMSYKFEVNYDPNEIVAQHNFMKDHDDPIYLEATKPLTPETLQELSAIWLTKRAMDMDEIRRARETDAETNSWWYAGCSTAADDLQDAEGKMR